MNPLLISGLDEATTGVDVVAYRREWLVDLVNERGHHLSEFIQALNVGKLRLQLLNSLVTDVPTGQIPHYRRCTGNFAARISDGRGRH